MNRLKVTELMSYGFVTEADNPEAEAITKSLPFWKRKFSREQREKLADRGHALPDGSFPITTVADLSNAVAAFGRAGNKSAARSHIVKRAKALGRLDLLPETWNIAKDTVKVSSTKPGQGQPHVEALMEHDLTGLPDDVRETVEKALTDGADAVERVAALEAQVAELTPDPDPVTEADPVVQAEIQKQADKIVALEKQVAASEDARATAEYTELAKARPGAFKDDDDKDLAKAAEFLKSLGQANREALDWLIGKLDAYEKIVGESDLFKSIGVNDAGSATAQIEALAKERQKENPDLTDAQARVLARKLRPDLKEAERQEAR